MFLYSTVSTLKPVVTTLATNSRATKYALAPWTYQWWELSYFGDQLVHPVEIMVATYTISPSFNLYRIVVFPAASRPTIKIRISFFPHSLSKSFENVNPMFTRRPEV